MNAVVEITQANSSVYDFICSEPISLSELCLFFTAQNLSFSERDLAKVGEVGSQIITASLQYRDVVRVFVSGSRLTVVCKTADGIQTLPEQIARIIEKAIDEREVLGNVS